MAVSNEVELIKALAWPVTALIAIAIFHESLAEVIKAISKGGSKLKFANVELELAKLAEARPSLEAAVVELQKLVVSESGVTTILAGIMQSGAADYVIVALGADTDKEWLTSRLFLLSALLERSRAVRSIVFTGRDSRFVGTAAPRDVRAHLGARFPEYEIALYRGFGAAANLGRDEFRGGALNAAQINAISREFLNPHLMADPGAPVSALSKSIVTAVVPYPLTNWVELDKGMGKIWELAEWVSGGMLASLMGTKLNKSQTVSTATVWADQATIKAIINQSGPFVALVDSDGNFQGLCDRQAIVEKAARKLVEQVGSD